MIVSAMKNNITFGEIFYNMVKWTVYLIWILHIAAVVYFALTDFFILLLWLVWCITGASWGYVLILMAEWKFVPIEKRDVK